MVNIKNFICAIIVAQSIGLFALAKDERVVLPTDVKPLHYKIFVKPDVTNLKFDGNVQIDLEVDKTTSRITLNAAELEFKKVTLEDVGTPEVIFDPKDQTATLKFDENLEPGKKYVLRIEYSGIIGKSASGLFALDYQSGNVAKRGLYTQFEASDARRFVPCFDEPNLKATFELSVTVADDLTPVSNTPVAGQTPAGKGLKTVHFAKTPKMSTYLLFFGLGEFERISQTVNGIDIGVVVKKGDTAKAQYALDAAVQILPFYEEYFGVKYPLPKLDMIAAPGTSQFFSAMENWGAILYFDRVILVDPAIATQADRRRVYLVIAHEMAHQWFGNLVTMSWWDDLWLNEGFATWMETLATDHFHPEWKAWLQLQQEKTKAMHLDEKEGTHAVIQPIYDVLQAGLAFDDITYDKGCAVIRMLEAYVGANEFKNGVRAYMKKYAYANTVTDDLWREIDNASQNKITEIAHDFTLQGGVPLIDVKRSGDNWILEQRHFAIDASTPKDRSWQVPVDAQYIDGKKIWKGIVSKEAPTTLKDVSRGIIVNVEQSSYFRTRYDNDAFNALLKEYPHLPVATQLGLIEDTFKLGAADVVSIKQFLLILDKIEPNLNPLILSSLVRKVMLIDDLYTGLPKQPEIRTYARRKLNPLLDRVTWEAQVSDNANTAELRSVLLLALGQLNDDAVIKRATKNFEVFLKDATALKPELRSTVLSIVAMQADVTRFEQFKHLAQTAVSVLEQGQYYNWAASSKNQKIAQMALKLALDKKTPATIAPNIIRRVAQKFPRLAFDFANSNHKWLIDHLDSGALSRFIPGMLADSYDRELIAALDSYADKYIPKTARQDLSKTKAGIQFYADFREKRIPEIDAWLKSQIEKR